MRLPPSSIDLPLNVSFPLYRRPSLDVSVWGRGVPDVNRGPVWAIKAVNMARTPVEVTGVYAGFIYMSLPMEATFGSKTVKLSLRILAGERQPPLVLQAGESALWTANLSQLAEELKEKGLTLAPQLRFLDSNRIDIERWVRRGRLCIMARNMIAMQSQMELAVAIGDGWGGLHKAKVRWTPSSWAALRRRRFPSAVTEVEIFEDLLMMHPRGAKGVSLPVDLAHIVGAEENWEVARAGLRQPTIVSTDPSRVLAGEPSGLQGDTAYFNVHYPEKTVVIGLRNERYARLVIEVEDPPAAVAAIQRAIGRR
jgi:hypothetical protein